ncbi:topoisomerase [Streptomyces sp. NPDC102364]|uniref:topoisomerase n=1 Tax=Streptomyces sp. NPDC102364 TaxID=3366161 RepID=UPI0037F43554
MASLKPKNLHVADSVAIAKRYHQSYQGSPAEAYVTARGLGAVANQFGLGYVDSALPGHERYAGYLALPYLRPAGGEDGVATVRFRCVADQCVKAPDGSYLFQRDEKERHEGHGKFMSLPADPPRLYNTGSLIEPSAVLVVVEGEFDTQSWAVAGVPAVGAPGTGTWRDYWTPALLGYETVFLIAEDEPGLVFMDQLAADIPNGKVIKMTDNRDSNSVLLNSGPEALKKRIGL